MEEKIYVGNGKVVQLENGAILKLSLSPDDIKKINDWSVQNDGWCNLDICQRQAKSAKGYTHYAKINTWKPNKEQYNQPQAPF